jgi:hypothetical protein
MTLLPILFAGSIVGAGCTILMTTLRPAHPDLRAALARLDATAPAGRVDPVLAVTAPRGTAWINPRHVQVAARVFGVNRYGVDLRLVGEAPESLVVRKVGYALLGLVFPLILSTACLIIGVTIPLTIPVLASLILGAVLFLVPDVDLHRRAATAREAMRRTVCTYLDLVALERAADAGTTEALDRAATISTSDEFTTIARALHAAELAGRPAWAGLADLGIALRINELQDLADIMALSGRDGAAVYATLRARAASLRTQLLTADAAAANAASEHMIIPVALLGIAFMALMGYPAFARILFT